MKKINVTCDVKDRVNYKELKPFQGKLKELNKENFEKIKKSIIEEGFFMPIGVWQNDSGLNILDGHQRVLVLEWLETNGYEIPEIPIFRIFADSFKNARKKLLHMVSQYGKVTGDGLYEFAIESEMNFDDLKNFSIPDMNLESFGKEYFEDNTVAGMCDEDEVPEQVEPITKLGDIYQLGNHRLMCGDSTSIDAVEKLMNGNKADMVFTDPPYGMRLDTDYSGMNGELADGSYIKRNNHKKVIGDNEDFSPELINTIFANFSEAKEIFMWGADYYAEHLQNKNEGSWVVWDKTGTESRDAGFGSSFELCWSREKHKRTFARIWWQGIFGVKDDQKTRCHPTQKPVQLAEWFFERWGDKCTSIVDLYGGSGSTLIACEKTNRKCFMMELDPHYCDVIVARWEKYTGNKAILIKE